MSLIELAADDVRCLHQARLNLDPGLNLIWGDNGSGKTSLLEAVFLLGRGRSFRTRNSERLIRHGQQRLVVFGRTGGEGSVISHALGIQVSKTDGTEARIDGVAVRSLTDLSESFPVQVIDPGIHKLVEEGANRRRRWLDWSVFHVEHGFGDVWLRYMRAVKQRNAALKKQPQQAAAWDGEVARLGEHMADARRRVVEQIQATWSSTVLALTGLDVQLDYHRGWDSETPLSQALVTSRARDQLKGITHSGPHRADLVLRLGGRTAKEVLSRGQQKLVAIAMTLAQVKLLQAQVATSPTLLLDDPAAELDGRRLGDFIDQVRGLGCQLILTSLQGPGGGGRDSLFGKPNRVFHVEQGRVTPV